MRMFNFTDSNMTSENWITEGQTTSYYDVTNKTHSNMTMEQRITKRPTIYDVTTKSPDDEITWDDATWILTSAFIIFTMQSGELEFRFRLNIYFTSFLIALLIEKNPMQ